MDLLHLSFVGGLKSHQDPPMPPTAQERLSAFRAAWPLASANTHRWKWLDDAAMAAREHERHAAALPGLEAARLSREMLDRIAGEGASLAA